MSYNEKVGELAENAEQLELVYQAALKAGGAVSRSVVVRLLLANCPIA